MNEAPLQLSILRVALELAQHPMFVIDADSQRIVDANPTACSALRCKADALIGQSWPHVATSFRHTTTRTIECEGSWLVVAAHEESCGRADQWPALRDPLTGLAGRDTLVRLIERERQGDSPGRLAVLFVDLDGFKLVNDTHGHPVGDRVLRVVADRIRNSVRPSDLVLRYGGDEFVVVVDRVTRRRDIERLVRRIQRGIRLPIRIANRDVVLSASVGIGRRTDKAASIESLIVEADRDMYRNKALQRAESLAKVAEHEVSDLLSPYLSTGLQDRATTDSLIASA
jgi:diguanylate cyclase (GGDEF)-like protein